MENSQVLHSVSKLFSTATFRKLVVEGKTDYLKRKIGKYKSILGINPETTNRDVIKSLYLLMNKNYRSEYLYKNHLFNKLIEDKKLPETAILNEIRVGFSIADTVLINGEPILYEVKTELDNPQKLISQLDDYQKAFAKINVITHESIYYKYYQVLKGSSVGLMYLSSKNKLITHKEAAFDINKLDHVVLFKLLRKSEFSLVIENYFGKIPAVPNTVYFKTCLDLAKQIPVQELYVMVFQHLKMRRPTINTFLQSTKTPRELKYICYTLDFNSGHYQNLHTFLGSPFKS